MMSSGRTRSTYVSLAIIAIALIALVLTPVIGQRYARPHQQELRNVAEPARSLVTEIHLSLALGGDALYDFVGSGNTAALARYHRAREREQRAYERLAALSSRLDPEVERLFDDLRDAEAEWHRTVDQFLRDLGTTETARRAALRTGVYADVLIAAARLDDAITRASQIRRQRILAGERVKAQLTVLLALVALVALGMLVLVGARLRRAVAEAEERRVDVERLLEAKGRMVRGLSHDLKNPLNVIHGHAALLEDGVVGDPTDAQRKSLAHIRRSVRSLLGILDDLLELWRAESGDIRVERRPTDVKKLVLDTVEAYGAVAETSGHRLCAEVDVAVPVLHTDPHRVRQVLGNLVSNAVKYTPAGGSITVRAHMPEHPPLFSNGRYVAIDVLDTGPGIPPDKTEEIFQEFTRLHGASVAGAGLGLSISRGIARLLGGDVTVASRPAGGAAFSLWLPTAAASDGATSSGPTRPRVGGQGSS
jgi:signal transduction histidine kinase